ncbi:Glucokinase [Methylobacterium symbioticum]|uniref:Glucokinase n=1 Tax=Methylobacterium symbioticum TaxID=2584084 RepID=A0A509EEW8_9HYPH|nr:Glucokinase [Methylobacterium symbioticum]
MWPHPVLLADIGGTYLRFAVLPAPGACPGPIRKMPTAGFPGPIAALQAYLDGPGTPRPRSAFLAVAGRVDGHVTRLTNAPWLIDLGDIGVALGLEAARLVNDYVPQAAALHVLDEANAADLARIGPVAAGRGPRLVLGPGTGLARLWRRRAAWPPPGTRRRRGSKRPRPATGSRRRPSVSSRACWAGSQATSP